MNLKTPITFSETGKVQKYEMMESQGNEMGVKGLILQSTNSSLASRLTKISGFVVLVNFQFHTKFCLPNINMNQTIMCSV